MDIDAVVYQRLALKGKKHLLLITAYRPCIQAIEQGFTTTTAQQHPSGDTAPQFKVLFQYAKVLGQCIAAAPMNRLEAQIMLEQFIQPKLGYPLAAACLTFEQCKKLDSLYKLTLISPTRPYTFSSHFQQPSTRNTSNHTSMTTRVLLHLSPTPIV
jgi:hypothetical protein